MTFESPGSAAAVMINNTKHSNTKTQHENRSEQKHTVLLLLFALLLGGLGEMMAIKGGVGGTH